MYKNLSHKTFNYMQLAKASDAAHSFLNTIKSNHTNFVFDNDLIEPVLQSIIFEKQVQQPIFPGVFATPIGDCRSDDPKLVPVKLIRVNPGAIIPVHSHGGFEYYRLLNNSKLIDTRDCYDEHCHCLCKVNEVHAVTNITSTPAYALIVLPTRVELTFLNEEEALKAMASSYEAIKNDEMYRPHNLFVRLLYADKLLQSEQEEIAEKVLEPIRIEQINNTIQLDYFEKLASKLSELSYNRRAVTLYY